MIKATKGGAEKVRRWTGHADIKVLLERYSHEFESARGGRRVEDDIKWTLLTAVSQGFTALQDRRA